MSDLDAQLAVIEERAKPTISELEVAARQIVIRSQPDADHCGELLRRCAERKKAIEAEFAPVCKAAYDAHKAAVAFRDRVLATVLPADKIAREKLSEWQREQERLAKIEADRLAAIERQRLEAERAERIRIETEQRAEIERQRQAAIEAAKAAKDKAALAEAKAIEVPQVYVEPPVEAVYVAPVAPPKVAGFSRRTTWKAVVVDESLVPREYMTANIQALDALARSTKGNIKIPGVAFQEVESTSVR